MKSVVWSAQGKQSPQNEDACFARPNLGLFAVADGVGGGPAGELASRMLVEKLSLALGDGELDKSLIIKVIETANVEINSYARETGNDGMACTLVLAWIAREKLHCFHIGDSRIYRLRNSELQQLTQDHSTLILKSDSSLKSVITRAVGVKSGVEVDAAEWDWLCDDVLILMSDGISDKLTNKEIENVMLDNALSMAEKARKLTWESEKKGGADDKTVVFAF